MPSFMISMALTPFIRMTTPAADISTFTTWATSLVTWLISTMESFLTFLVGHPIALVGLVLSLIVTAAGMLRRMIGG